MKKVSLFFPSTKGETFGVTAQLLTNVPTILGLHLKFAVSPNYVSLIYTIGLHSSLLHKCVNHIRHIYRCSCYMHMYIAIYHNNLRAIDEFSLSDSEMKVPFLFILETSFHWHLFHPKHFFFFLISFLFVVF